MYRKTTTITHWVPFVTVCPVTRLPELIYIKVTFGHFAELFEVRRRLKECVRSNRLSYMEDIAERVMNAFEDAIKVEVNLAFNRHKVVVERE